MTITKKAIGDIRPSQLITTFGPGAVVDLQTLSVIVSGIDNWFPEDPELINEPRLERALRVEKFYSPKPAQGNFFTKRGTIPAYIFPRYQVCPVCRSLARLGETDLEFDAKWGEIKCKAPGCRGRGRFRATTMPAPFVVACPSGHLDDFPWREYAHRGQTNCTQRMEIVSLAKTGSVADVLVKCKCGNGTRSASDAFGENRSAAVGPCTKRRPWLGADNIDRQACVHSNDARAIQRGATNGWFSVVRSALSIKEAASEIGIAILSCDARQIEKIDTVDKLKVALGLGMFPSLEKFDANDVWTALRRMRGEIETDEIGLRYPEWIALRDPQSAATDRGELFLEEGVVPDQFKLLVERVVLARKLLEVRALVGFTRIDNNYVLPSDDDVIAANISPISKSKLNWLPAVRVRGEGILFELKEEAVQQWEALPEVKKLMKAMADKFREWETERGVDPLTPFPGARYVLLHSLAHALIRQLSLDCGYSASAVRERIYSSSEPDRRMAGILLYTASADSEGSLGGLVDLGSPDRIEDLLVSAIESACRCSSDPLCADHKPDVHATINAAACHACLLVSETSCECFNRFLDRNVLTATMAGSNVAYFKGLKT